MTSDAAANLLLRAEQLAPDDWLTASILTAAAIRLATGEDIIMVGGSAQAFWTDSTIYHPTDLDLWFAGPMTARVRATMVRLGFRRAGRHWTRTGSLVPVEFPGGPFAGVRERTALAGPTDVAVPVIGLDDLYLDRLAQATVSLAENTVEFESALALAAYRFDSIDWNLVSRLVSVERRSNPMVGDRMARHNRRIRRLIRTTIGGDS